MLAVVLQKRYEAANSVLQNQPSCEKVLQTFVMCPSQQAASAGRLLRSARPRIYLIHDNRPLG